jgi:hypothetical protein
MSKAQGSPRLRWALFALCVCAAGCSLFGSYEKSLQNIRSAGTDPRDTLWRIADTLAQRMRQRDNSVLDVLALSGGGQNGAYASGFLRGWRARSGSPLPDFDLVTAVSSGALQAPYALIGTKEALERGAAVYRDSAITLAPTPESWFRLRASSGDTDNTAYLRLIRNAVDEKLQSELAPLFALQRQLAIATTDMDLGGVRVWDFGHELGTNDKGLKRAHALLLASASVPGAMEPQLIDDHIHASANVLGSLLVPFKLEHYRALAERLHSRGVSEALEIRLWVVLNSFTEAPTYREMADDRAELGQRANAIAFAANQAELVERLSNLAYAINGTVRGLRMQLKITTIPRALIEEAGVPDDYDESWMSRLEQVGYDRALSGDAGWDRVVMPGAPSK